MTMPDKPRVLKMIPLPPRDDKAVAELAKRADDHGPVPTPMPTPKPK